MKIKYILLAIVSLGLLGALLIPTAPALSVAAADNLASNGDFELGSTAGWDTPQASLETATVYEGSYALKLTATSAYSGAAFKTIPVRSNATITVSFYYRYASTPGGAYHVFTYQGADTSVGPYSGADASFKAPTGCNSISTWQKISYTFNSGSYTAITLKFSPGGSGGTPCYIDNLVVTSEGGDETNQDPYLTSFGTKMNRPQSASANLIKNGGFESDTNATWNTTGFIKGGMQVVEDPTAPEGSNSLFFDGSDYTTRTWHGFAVSVEKYTQYTFSAWVKSPRLSEDNDATATFGVMNVRTNKFMVYEPYQGNGYGSALLSSETLQLVATSPDGEWHLRSVTFNSGSHSTVNIAVYGAQSQLYLDDIALYKSSDGVEYISSLRTDSITPATNSGNKYCADEDSLVKGIYMTTNDAQLTWSDNPAWRNGFLSFTDAGDSHGTVLKYTASAKTQLNLHYIDWIDVTPNTSYTLTLDVKRLAVGDGRIALLDDDYDSPKEFYTIHLTAVDSDWVTYSVTFNTKSFSRIGFAIVDGGGSAFIDEVRLFETADGIATEPQEVVVAQPTLKPIPNGTAVMEMASSKQLMVNSGFESGALNGWMPYQGTTVKAAAAHSGSYGAHLKGDGSWGALIEQLSIPVQEGKTYTFSYWYKAVTGGANITLKGATTATQYSYIWANQSGWINVTATFTVQGDTALILNICGGGNGVAESVYLDDVSLKTEAMLGVAFRMEMEGYRIYTNSLHQADLYAATVIPYGDGETYRLLRMGAVVTNDGAVAPRLTLDSVNGDTVKDVPAVYLMNVTENGCQFAVRVTNVPERHKNTPIYARPYYVFEKDGEEIVVYGDLVSRSYNG